MSAGVEFWRGLRVPPRRVRWVVRCAPRRYRRRLIDLWLRWRP